jgi:hypothetical protein
MSDSFHCKIQVKGHLSSQWVDWFSGLEIENHPNGKAVLTGCLPDQAALYGILKRMGNLGIALVSLDCAEQRLEKNWIRDGYQLQATSSSKEATKIRGKNV